MTTVGVIPARGGSKGIPRKNLAQCGGKSLLAWTAEAALSSRALDRVVLSTDDEEIAAEGRALGLDVPFMRPARFADDGAPMHQVFKHAKAELELGQSDAIALLQPTSPLRRERHITEAVEKFRQENAATLVRVMPVPHRFVPESVMRYRGGKLIPLSGGDIGPTSRQEKEKLFARNGPAVLIVRGDVIDARQLYGDPTVGYEMDEWSSIDIDGVEDLRIADLLIRSGWQ
jgi:CMP-N,N'-diacetyllegionaminic acid synthase